MNSLQGGCAGCEDKRWGMWLWKFKLKVTLCCDFMFTSVGFSISFSSQYCAYALVRFI